MHTFTLQEPYQPRPIRCLGVWEVDGWQIKTYGIAYRLASPRAELIAAAQQIARRTLPHPAITDQRYGVGYVGIHDGRGANFVFVDWFADENELHHHVFIGPSDQPARLEVMTRDQPIACVWDMQVMAFERQAWLDTVLINPRGPDLSAYLACQLNVDV
jgi:hypothetical protein